MTKALLKKEFLQIKKMYLTNKRNGKEAAPCSLFPLN